MTKFNLIVPKRGRDDYLALMLNSINQANSKRACEVRVYIGEDLAENLNKLNYNEYNNLQVQHLYIPNLPQAGDLFCRGHLINELLKKMEQDYDIFSIIDLDRVYSKDFFSSTAEFLTAEGATADCLIHYGDAMTDGEGYEEILQQSYDYDYLRANYPHQEFSSSSQISVTKVYHERLKKILALDSIFDTATLGYHFLGWGREDTLVRKLLKWSNARVAEQKHSSMHIWHETQPLLEESVNYNTSILALLTDELKRRLGA